MAKNKSVFGRNYYAGHRVSLRSKATDQIKKVDFISNSLPDVLGDILVTTWGGIIMGTSIAILGGLTILWASQMAGGALILANFPAYIMIAIGTLILAVMASLINPSFGSQLFFSVRLMNHQFQNYRLAKKTGLERGKYRLRMYRINDDYPSVVELLYKNHVYYMTVYSVHGSVGRISFEDKLDYIGQVYTRMLRNLERNTQITTVNSVQEAHVKPVKIAENATEAMRRRQQKEFMTIDNQRQNRQLRTLVVVSSPSLETLMSKTIYVEQAFDDGIVTGYTRLEGDSVRKEIKNIYA